jgi:hypothetical protein
VLLWFRATPAVTNTFPSRSTSPRRKNGRRFEERTPGEFTEAAVIPGTRAALAREGA